MSYLFGRPIRDGSSVGEILVGAHHGDASKIEVLPRLFGQRLMGLDLGAPLAQDRPEVVHGLVVDLERVRLRRRGRGLGECGRHECGQIQRREEIYKAAQSGDSQEARIIHRRAHSAFSLARLNYRTLTTHDATIPVINTAPMTKPVSPRG